MRPGTYDLETYRGDTYTWQFRLWKDADRTIPADLTGVEVKAEIRPGSGRTPVAELTCTPTLPNLVDVHLPVELWDTLTYLNGVWDLQLTYADVTDSPAGITPAGVR